jgi:glycosyltransferase involved in cell wall biosynthesis
VLEAATRGAALVLSDIPTFRELWRGAALFVRPDDAEGFAVVINRLAVDTTLRRQFSGLARLRAASFAPDRQVVGVQRVYAAALAAHAPTMATAG